MALLKFLKGNYSSLSTKAITEGQVLICGDTGEMFVDVAADKRVKIGDFVVVSNLEALEALDATVVPTSRLYYVEDGNILARSNGTGWTQINKQKTLAELGGVSSITYATDKAALVQADADNATAISDLETLVGSIPESATATTVVGYIDEKTAGIASNAALTELAGRVTTAEGKLDTLTGADTVEGSVAKALKDAKAYTDEKDTAMGARMDAVEGSITTLTGEESVAGSVKAIAKSYADGKDSAIQAAQAKADSAYALAEGKTTMAEVEAKNYATKTEAQGYADAKDDAIAAAKKAGDDAQADVDALEAKVGVVPADTTVVQMIADAQAEATYDDTALKNRVQAIEDDYLKAADKTELSDAIAGVKSNVDTFLAAAEIGSGAIDTLKELQDYIGTHGEAAATLTTKVGVLETTVGKAADGENEATGLVKGVADNAAAIAAEKSRAEGVEAELAQADVDNLAAAKKYTDDKITDLGIGDYAKQADLDTHTGNSDIHITAAERTKWNTAEGKAHTHDNKALLDTYTQTEADLADAVAKKHEHANATELAKIQDGDVAKWNAAQANAEATAAAALASAKTELEGKITAAQTAAEGKVTALANGAVAANTAAIEVINGTGTGSISKALSDAKAYTDALENGQVTTNKNDIASLLEQITWGSF